MLRSYIDKIRQWNPVSSVIVTLLGYFGSQIFGVIIILVLGASQGWEADTISRRLTDDVWLTLLLGVLIYGSYLLVIKMFLNWTRHRLRETGLRMPQSWVDIPLYIFSGYAVYFISLLLVMAFVDANIPAVDLQQKQDLGIDIYTGGIDLVAVFITLVILPPVVEEIVTRGFLYSGLRKKLRMVGAGIITSLVFAAAHLEWGNDAPLLWAAAIDTFILSAVLIYIREKTNSLYPAIGLHMLKNFLAFLALFVFHVA